VTAGTTQPTKAKYSDDVAMGSLPTIASAKRLPEQREGKSVVAVSGSKWRRFEVAQGTPPASRTDSTTQSMADPCTGLQNESEHTPRLVEAFWPQARSS